MSIALIVENEIDTKKKYWFFIRIWYYLIA